MDHSAAIGHTQRIFLIKEVPSLRWKNVKRELHEVQHNIVTCQWQAVQIFDEVEG